MDQKIIAAPPFEELERIYLIQATLKSFKGRKDVIIYLFRTNIDDALVEEELRLLREMDLVGKADADTPEGAHADNALLSILEAFTAEEGNLLLPYLEKRYDEQISEVVVSPLELPVPLGMVPFSAIPEGKTMGFIRFNAVPDYDLPFGVHGFYDLDNHEPLVAQYA